jgi:hypothetical protein
VGFALVRASKPFSTNGSKPLRVSGTEPRVVRLGLLPPATLQLSGAT